MKRIALLVAAVAVTACQGSTGPQGPAGPAGAPYKRTASYCNSVNDAATAANSWTLTASCTNVADIPIEGWCYAVAPLPATASFSNDAPINWADATKLAGWSCTWGWQGSPTATSIPATVEICCATPQ